ncbi:hypothetical protein NLJ89_g12236 [Agrocybe chaxingu]|uniref:Uncharacterized protein n=1 Tax=Agrocybe chaxingu TaxID=84603 RepID=A0A9W8MQE9_9AGAR|nr:hypothetical protein NLJ89_g12236 [Agrocybe chaxingu]
MAGFYDKHDIQALYAALNLPTSPNAHPHRTGTCATSGHPPTSTLMPSKIIAKDDGANDKVSNETMTDDPNLTLGKGKRPSNDANVEQNEEEGRGGATTTRADTGSRADT